MCSKVAILLDNLAVLYNSQSEFSVAENYYEQALAVREEALGSQHPDVAGSFNRLAVFYHTQKQYFAAESIYKRALRIYVAALGADDLSAAKTNKIKGNCPGSRWPSGWIGRTGRFL